VDFLVIKEGRRRSEATQPNYSTGISGTFRGDRAVEASSDHSRLVTRLRMSEAIPLLPLYTFTAWTGMTT